MCIPLGNAYQFYSKFQHLKQPNINIKINCRSISKYINHMKMKFLVDQNKFTKSKIFQNEFPHRNTYIFFTKLQISKKLILLEIIPQYLYMFIGYVQIESRKNS